MDFNKNNYDLIGIGENTHGELTSWNIRYKIVKHLLKKYKKVYILTETFDSYIKELNTKNITYKMYNDGFYPNMIYNSNKTKEHLQITKKFNNLIPDVYFMGIDIQVVEYDSLYKNISPLVYKIISKYKKHFLQYSNTNKRGHYRNYYNYKIICDLIKLYKKQNTIFVYFAQNEHISYYYTSEYKTEGYFFKKYFKEKYINIGTLALRQYNLWKCSLLVSCKPTLYIVSDKKWKKLLKKKKKVLILPKNSKYILPFGNHYNSKHFDYVYCENESIIKHIL